MLDIICRYAYIFMYIRVRFYAALHNFLITIKAKKYTRLQNVEYVTPTE